MIIYNYQFQEQDMIQELVVHVDDSDGYPKYVFEKYSLMWKDRLIICPGHSKDCVGFAVVRFPTILVNQHY